MTIEAPSAAPRLPGDPSGFASRQGADLVPSASVLNPEPVRRRPVHTATARVLTVGGLAALIGLVAAATIDALRASHWNQPRPVLDGRMAVAAAVMLIGGVAWAVAAAVNARRAGVRDGVGPFTVPCVVAVQVASWFVVEHFAEGDQRRLAWAAWAGLVLVLHWGAVLKYRTTATVFDETEGHFSLVAWLPLLGGAVAVTSVFQQGALFGLPMVGAMSPWLVIEAYQAMAGWDRGCRTRITGVDPAAPKPVREQYAAALAQARIPGPGPERTSFHHTMIPRAMVLASLVLGLSLPAWVAILEHEGHVSVTGIHTEIDNEAGRLMTGLAVASLAAYGLGWLWWSVAAALNATSHSRWTVSAWSAPIGYAVSIAVVGSLPVITDRVATDLGTVLVMVGAFVLAIAHFAVLREYRHTAAAIGGAVAPWTRVIILPWAGLGFSIVIAFLSQALGDVVFERIMQGSWVVFYALYAVSLYSAMASFDRASRGGSSTRPGDDQLPEFLKKRRRSADRGA